MSSATPSYFTVDRSKRLQIGQTLTSSHPKNHYVNLLAIDGVYTGLDALNFANEQFPKGITFHGAAYLFNRSVNASPDPKGNGTVYFEPMLEVFFELVRRASFPDCPSRFQSLFAWDGIGAAQQFRQTSGQLDAPIYRVEANAAFRADMRLLTLGGNAIGGWLFAERYWSGCGSLVPNWEILLTPPVLIAEKVG